MTDATRLTLEEIQQYREQLEQLKDNSTAIAQFKVIEQCEGDLEQAARMLSRRAGLGDHRKAGTILESALTQARQLVCNDNFKEGLAPDLISGVFTALISANNPLLIAVATPCASYIVKMSLIKFCRLEDSESKD